MSNRADTRGLPRGAGARRRAGVLLLTLLAAAASKAQEPDLSWVDYALLAHDGVQVETDRDERPLTVHVRVATRVDAAPEAIWNVLRSCELAPKYVPTVTSCRSIEVIDGGAAELFMQTVKPAFFLPTFEHVFRLDYEPYRRIGVHKVSGPIEHMEGVWWLVPQDGGDVLLVYDLALDPGMPLPRFLVRATLKRDLPRLVAAVRELAETGAELPIP